MCASPSQLHNTVCVCSGVFLASLALFLFLSSNALINGDAALYQQQIVNLDFTQRVVHLGYYLLGSLFIHLLPLSPDYALNLMNCFFGALSALLIYRTALTLTHNHRVAALSVTVLATNYLFLVNAVYAEVYLPQLFLFLLALQFVLSEKALLAGVAFGLSVLVTPSALFGLPSLLLLQKERRAQIQLTATAFLIVVIVLLPHGDDYFKGGRGILKAVSSTLSIKEALVKEGREIASSFAWQAVLLLAGIVPLMRDKRLHRFGVALISLWFCSFIFGEKYGDVPVQLPTYTLLSLVGGLGGNYLLSISKGHSRIIYTPVFLLLIACVSITGYGTFRRITGTTQALTEYRDTVLDINRRAQPNYLVLGGWTEGILFEHYSFQRSYTGVWINTEWLAGTWGERMQEESREKLSDALSSGREIWLLGDTLPFFPAAHLKQYVIAPFRNGYRARAKTP